MRIISYCRERWHNSEGKEILVVRIQVLRESLTTDDELIFTMPLSLLLQQLRPLLRIPPSRAGIGRRVVVVATRAVPFLLFSPPRTPRPFGTALHLSPPLRSKKNVNFPPRPKPPPDEEIEESFLKGSGPGGQKIVRAT